MVPGQRDSLDVLLWLTDAEITQSTARPLSIESCSGTDLAEKPMAREGRLVFVLEWSLEGTGARKILVAVHGVVLPCSRCVLGII